MKKILAFICMFMVGVCNTHAAGRGENAVTRAKNVSATTTSSAINKTNTNRVTTSRSGDGTTSLVSRSVTTRPTVVLLPKSSGNRKTATRQSVTTQTRSTTARNTNNTQKIVSRAAATKQLEQTSVETRTGAEYEQCKSAFFTCMDQFCQLKNDNFRRCSCNDRVFDFQEITDIYQEASERLTEFSENLDVVGMTRAQATAMKTSSEGEDALAEDKSASKQLLQAIMDSISGKKASVGGKYKDLNMIDMSSDMSNAFGMDDSGQLIAQYNGATLYKAVFPTCRSAVAEDCNSASLQRAINAYLMAIEQDCNTVASALKSKEKTLKNATHESSAMLDLARVENRQKHNSDDFATCLTNVETAVKSDQVCSADYHRCLDYGQFIDVTTGAPITGVADFYKLAEILTFPEKQNIKDQQLSKVSQNRKFVQFFENKTKKFATDALNSCTEIADEVWSQYLDRALLDIYYAQKDKVKTIQDSCINLVTACYENQGTAISSAMAKLTGDFSILEKPNAIALTTEMCNDYITSCNNMFPDDVIDKYVETKDTTDTVTACRAIAQQCFDKFGGTGYENFYYPYSGLFNKGEAIDWFTLYKYELNNGTYDIVKDSNDDAIIVSPCAQELMKNDVCKDTKILETVFGGFDKYEIDSSKVIYSYSNTDDYSSLSDRNIRTKGVASEMYYKIIDTLSNNCSTLRGYFVQHQFTEQYGYSENNFCELTTDDSTSEFYVDSTYNSEYMLNYWYKFIKNENICPQNYSDKVDTQSWGACSCWENGGYRSKNGTTPVCMPILPFKQNKASENGSICTDELLDRDLPTDAADYAWCNQLIMSTLGQICPTSNVTSNAADSLEIVSQYVPYHKVSDNAAETVNGTGESSETNTESKTQIWCAKP